MESPSFHPSSPPTPLHPATPDRTNRQPLPYSPSRSSLRSPTFKEDPFFSTSHRSSDVQGKVLQFNQLADTLSPKRKDNDAALRRAVLGREEAESRIKRLEEDNRRLHNSVEEGRGRELKVAQRLEAMMEEAQRHKESGQRARTVYEKEIRRAKKEVFSLSSNHVMLQEELKTAKNRFTLMREEVEVQKRKVESREQEAFEAQYQLVGVQEELDTLSQRLKLIKEERDTLRTSLKEEEVARIAAEGMIPLPPSTPSDEFSSPRKTAVRTPLRVRRGSDKENEDPIGKSTPERFVDELQKELTTERRRHEETLSVVNFMKLECQLQACSCRRAEQQGASYIWNDTLPVVDSRPASGLHLMASSTAEMESLQTQVEGSVIIHPVASPELESLIEFSPATGTFRKSQSPTKQMNSISFALEEDAQTPLDTAVADRPSPPATLTIAPPLAPTDISESPSILSLPSRASDQCYMIATVSNEHPQGAAEQAVTLADLTIAEDRDTTPAPAHPEQEPEPSSTHSTPRNLYANPSRAQSRAAPRDSVRSAGRPQSSLGRVESSILRPSSSMSRNDSTTLHIASPPSPVANESGMRFIETSQTTTIPLADPATPSVPRERTRMPFTPGATKTREEALQSIRRWREGNSRTGGEPKARARSVTTGSATPRRPPGGGSPARRDVSAPEKRRAGL